MFRCFISPLFQGSAGQSSRAWFGNRNTGSDGLVILRQTGGTVAVPDPSPGINEHRHRSVCTGPCRPMQRCPAIPVPLPGIGSVGLDRLRHPLPWRPGRSPACSGHRSAPGPAPECRVPCAGSSRQSGVEAAWASFRGVAGRSRRPPGESRSTRNGRGIPVPRYGLVSHLAVSGPHRDGPGPRGRPGRSSGCACRGAVARVP